MTVMKWYENLGTKPISLSLYSTASPAVCQSSGCVKSKQHMKPDALRSEGGLMAEVMADKTGVS